MKAPLSRRFWACLIDWNIFGAAGWLFFFSFGKPTNEGHREYQIQGPLGLVAVLAFWLAVYVVPEWLFGATLGKRLLGLRVQRKSGGSIGFWAALIRRVFDFVDFFLSCGLVALLVRGETALGQRLGDLVTGSVVVSTITAAPPDEK